MKKTDFFDTKFKSLFLKSDNIYYVTEQIIELYKKDPSEFTNISNLNFFLDICIYLQVTTKERETKYLTNKKNINKEEKINIISFIDSNKKNKHLNFFKSTLGMFKKVLINNLFFTFKEGTNCPLFFKLLLIKEFNAFTTSIIKNKLEDDLFIKEINSFKSYKTHPLFGTNHTNINISFYNNLFLINPNIYIELYSNDKIKLNDELNQNPLFYLQSFDNPLFEIADTKKWQIEKNKLGKTFIENIIDNIELLQSLYISTEFIKNLYSLSSIPSYKQHNTLLNSLKATFIANNHFLNYEKFNNYYNNIDQMDLVYIPLDKKTKSFLPFKSQIHPYQLLQENHIHFSRNIDIIHKKNKNQDFFSHDVFGYFIKNNFEIHNINSKYLFDANNDDTSDEGKIIDIFKEGISFLNLTGLYTLELIYNRNVKLDLSLSILNTEQKILAIEAYFKTFYSIEQYPLGFLEDQFYLSSVFKKLLNDDLIYKKIDWNYDKIKATILFYDRTNFEKEKDSQVLNYKLLESLNGEDRIVLLKSFLDDKNIKNKSLFSYIEGFFLKENIQLVEINNNYKKRI